MKKIEKIPPHKFFCKMIGSPKIWLCFNLYKSKEAKIFLSLEINKNKAIIKKPIQATVI